ncbi:MAG: OmpA family protein [Halobacteriovoraceae bacterium]|jgi:chemotaxis protein MotB|nr:OmpA family protein [Halobacteriovoraceae bacterium]
MSENIHKLHFASADVHEVQIQARKRKPRAAANGWVMSFADIVTVLLCFFIIFYMLEKQYDHNYGFGPSAGTVQEYKAKMQQPEILSLIETFHQLPKAVVKNKAQFIEVHFPPEMFFESGKTKLTESGLSVMQKLVEPMKKVKSGYILQIQGYTDDASVRRLDSRWWKNNMELSIQRALEVYEFFIKHGVERKVLSVTGFGANKPLVNETNDMQRRISLKFEPVLDVKK